MASRTGFDVQDHFHAAKQKSFPAYETHRRIIDWRFAILASLMLWALIIALGVAIFEGLQYVF
jgi:hypothetical protein